MLKSSRLKAKKSSAQPNTPRGPSVKQMRSGSRSGLVKSTPGFSLYSSDEIRKSDPKSKVHPQSLHPANLDAFESVRRDDDVVSQVQLVDEKNKRLEMKTAAPLSTESHGDPWVQSSPSPRLDKNSELADVRTPFNKRLISSTPDPERLFPNAEDINTYNVDVARPQLPSNPSPQLVPERDTDTIHKDTISSTITTINAMLANQRQNQLLWQQQLEQFKQPNVIKIEDKDKPVTSSMSAFHPWRQEVPIVAAARFNLDQRLVTDRGESKENENDLLGMHDSQQKAIWVPEYGQQENLKNKEEKNCAQIRNETNEGSDINSQAYNAFVSSTQVSDFFKDKEDDVIHTKKPSVQNSSESDESDIATKSMGAKRIENVTKVIKVKSDSSSRSKTSSSKINVAKSKFGVKVFPIKVGNAQENLKNQLRSSTQRKISSKLLPQPKTVVAANEAVSENRKKKKVLHVSLPRDERGVDVPPNVSIDENTEVDVKNADVSEDSEDKSGLKGSEVLVNESLSVCADEVNLLLSKESGDSNLQQNDCCSSSPLGFDISRKGLVQSDGFLETVGDAMNFKQMDQKVLNVNNSSKMACEVVGETQDDLLKNDDVLGVDCEVSTMMTSGNVLSESSPRAFESNGVGKANFLVLGNRTDETNTQEAQSVGQDDKASNTNQNYHEEEEIERRRSKRFRLHYLEKMADKTLKDIACRLIFKATAVRDKELRDLIDDMIFHTDITLAREDGQLRSSQAFFMEENGRLKKRLHNVNKQLEAKERQERQGGFPLGVTNTDVMHLERKNLYLRQERDRLDMQVTNLLEEKSMWLVKQQDLVKTISIKDHEILKLEEKYQEERTRLHKAVDEATKNSQGVHYKLSVADMEISNLEQRLKAKDRDLAEMKDAMKDMEEDLKCCTDSRRDKNREIQRLQDLVDTLKVGMDEVVKAYETTAQSQPTTVEQRQGIESLRRFVTESLSTSPSLTNLPEQIEKTRTRRKSLPDYTGPEFSISTSTRQQLPLHIPTRPHHDNRPMDRENEQMAQHRHPLSHRNKTNPHHSKQNPQQHQLQYRMTNHQEPDRDIPRRDQPDRDIPRRDIPRRDQSSKGNMSQHQTAAQYTDASFSPPDYGKGPRPKHDDGTLTVAALQDHNRRLSPVDRSLWHSLDTGHVMPRLDTAEPYYSDSEIHVANSRIKKRSHEDQFDISQRRRQRRVSDDFTNRRKSSREKQNLSSDHGKNGHRRWSNDVDRLEDSHTFPDVEQRYRDGGNRSLEDASNRDIERRFHIHSGRNRTDIDNEIVAGELEELESIPLHGEDESDIERSRYSVTDYFNKYPSVPKKNEQQVPRFPLNSKDYWISGDEEENGDDRRIRRDRRRHSREEFFQPPLHPDDRYPDLESMSVSEMGPPASETVQDFDGRRGPGHLAHTSTLRQFPDGIIEYAMSGDNTVQTTKESYPLSQYDQPLSSSYPGLKSTDASRHYHPYVLSNGPYPSLMSTSLPHSSHRRTDQYYNNDGLDTIHHSSHPQLPPMYQYDHQTSSRVNDEGVNDKDDGERVFIESGRLPTPIPYRSQPHVTFREPSESEQSLDNPSQSYNSDFMNARTSFPPHSSPVHTSDISVSRRATKGSESSQQDFFRGTELSASYSSISDIDNLNYDENYSNNQKMAAQNGEESFNTGIASLDSKIAQLEAKIKRTKAVFS